MKLKLIFAMLVATTAQYAVAQSAMGKAPLVAVSPSQIALPLAPAPTLSQLAAPPTNVLPSPGGIVFPTREGVTTTVSELNVPIVFEVRKTDTTLREVLVRWSTMAGWVHKPEHWTIDRDLPVSGTADSSVFGMDFRNAARKLLQSSELTDRPLQPCFYSNNVLRVVPKAELCDKSAQ